MKIIITLGDLIAIVIWFLFILFVVVIKVLAKIFKKKGDNK